ncbi:MAG: alpha/beta hydrolase [Pseudomonadota bacterium]
MTHTEPTSIICADSVPLSGRLFVPDAPKVAVIISSGTGFPQQFYEPLARHFAARGGVVLTYDYRGIAGSSAGVPGPEVDIPDWGRLDLDAAIGFLRTRFPDLPVTHLGHSVGGHIVGFAKRQAEVARHAWICSGGGTWFRHWPSRWPMELYFWWVLGPSSIARYGHVRAKGGWRGSPLPGKAFRTWRRWSHRRGYYRRELRDGLQPHHFEKVEAPVASWSFTDDGIATPAAVGDILECYPNADVSMVLRAPADYGKRKIGHQGAFRPGFEPLWDEWWSWLAKNPQEGREMP